MSCIRKHSRESARMRWFSYLIKMGDRKRIQEKSFQEHFTNGQQTYKRAANLQTGSKLNSDVKDSKPTVCAIVAPPKVPPN